MSGNATKIPTRRVTSAEHLHVIAAVSLELDLLGIPYMPTTWLSGKESHGDVDIVVSDDHWPKEKSFLFPKSLGQESRNGFTHIAWPIPNSDEFVQVDFIRIEQRYLQKPGQVFVDPQNQHFQPEAFESTTRFEQLASGIAG